MAILLLYKYNFHYIRENEIGPLNIDPETLKFQSTQLSGPNRRIDLFNQRWEDLTDLNVIYRTEIPKKDLITMIKKVEDLLISDELSNFIILLLGTTTHFYNREFSMSFLMSWTLIEKKIVEEYNQIIEDQIDMKKQVEKLRNGKFKTIVDKLDILRITGTLNNEEYENFMFLKKRRNQIIHEGIGIDKKDAEQCLDLTIKIIKEILKFNKSGEN